MKKTIGILAASLFLSGNIAMADPITDAVKNENRTAEAKLRDEYRNPQQTLRFFGIEPDMTIVEIWPGGGWYTDILANLVKEDGKFIAAHFFLDESSPGYFRSSLESFKQKVANDAAYKDIRITAFHPVKAPDIAEPGSADAVLTFRNVHNWYMGEGEKDVKSAFKAFYKALKPGGILGVVEHRLPESAANSAMKESGYVKQSLVVSAAESAGFKLVGQSDINANSQDTADHPKGVWTLPPTLALKDQDRDKYLAIGESDRMTLKFIKPKN
ncbi:class I SAM-dependent methyltransferase [Alteromonas pelagimontana]|uniref:Class I SAM-dependent methyltransferase n=1 Tax=Alteromonas pelagimontana TaxID=1858656 RepID=A0A6M4MD82_9ALTE|nr:class I SAM-dependent methyltransferase [Alteromonas pelagimontana]QJR80798.1 class I SAM-dependent methyltransferase [Alteromonas pelagimontana]